MTSTLDAKLSRDVQRVHDLIRLACDSAATEAEARTAAWAAVRLIHLRGLLVLAVAPQPAPPPPPPVDDGRYINAKFASACRVCGDTVYAGQPCWWRRSGGVEHLACHHSRRGST